MSTMITEDCINCAACEPECPNQAIREGDTAYVINPNLCTECVGFYGIEMCQEVCPVVCCVPNPLLRETEEDLYKRAFVLHGASDIPAYEELDAETSRFQNPNWANDTDDTTAPAEDWTPYWDE